MQNNQKYLPEDTTIISQMNYTNALLQKINEILFTLRVGADATREFQNLLFLLTDEIRKPIDPELNRIRQSHSIKVNDIRKMNKYPEITFAWSSRHKSKYKSILICREQSEGIYEMLNVIINRLDELGLLMNREQQIKI